MKKFVQTTVVFLMTVFLTCSAVFYGIMGTGKQQSLEEQPDAVAVQSGETKNDIESKKEQYAEQGFMCTVLGDSISKGYSGDKDIEIECYGSLVVKRIASDFGCTYTLENYSQNGLASEKMNENILTREEVLMDLGDSDLILITLGSNDLLNECKSVVQDMLGMDTGFKTADEALGALEDSLKQNPLLILSVINALANWDYQTFEVQWLQMMDTVNSVRKEDAEVIVTNIYNPVANMELPATMNQVVEDIIGNMNKIMEEHAREYGYQVADAAGSPVSGYVQRDGLHPDQDGQQILADLVYDAYRDEK